MRMLLTSDWQVDSQNLDLCEIMLAELLAAADRYKPDAIIHAGDVKEQYSPVPVPVVQFSVRAVKAITASYRLIILKGNHDRISQSADSTSWLDILKVAGAETIVHPRVRVVGGVPVAFLPFQHDKSLYPDMAKQVRAEAVEWMTRVTTDKSVLVFHDEMEGTRLSEKVVSKNSNGLSARILRTGKYTACFGGHIHYHQQLTHNTWTVGSPFCQDWGEANQSKGLLLVDI